VVDKEGNTAFSLCARNGEERLCDYLVKGAIPPCLEGGKRLEDFERDSGRGLILDGRDQLGKRKFSANYR
jgi:hypothetical protein